MYIDINQTFSSNACFGCKGLTFLWDLSEQLSQCPISYGAAERPPFEWCDSNGYSDYGSVTATSSYRHEVYFV